MGTKARELVKVYFFGTKSPPFLLFCDTQEFSEEPLQSIHLFRVQLVDKLDNSSRAFSFHSLTSPPYRYRQWRRQYSAPRHRYHPLIITLLPLCSALAQLVQLR